MRCLSIVFLTLISIFALGAVDMVTTATAEDAPNESGEPNWLELKGFELDKLIVMLADPAMRDLVCQLANDRNSPGTFSQSGGFNKIPNLLSRIDQLVRWGVIHTKITEDGITVIEAVPGYGEETMRRWAKKYCTDSDSCGTAK